MTKILVIDNDEKVRSSTIELFTSRPGNKYQLIQSDFIDFERHITDVDLVITDYNHDSVDASAGLHIYEKIRDSKFAPVVIYSGFVPSIDQKIMDSQGPFLRVIEKGAGSSDILVAVVDEVIASKEFQVKMAVEENLAASVNKNFREYYWNHIQPYWDDFKDLKTDALQRILSRKIVKDIYPTLSEGDLIHPIEFYEHPVPDAAKLETGSVLMREGNYYICINNSCDIEVRLDNTCKATKIYLLEVKQIDASWYSTRSAEEKAYEEDFKLLNNNGDKRDSKFILPKTFFFPGGYVDFGEITTKDLQVQDDGKIKLDAVGVIVAKIHAPFIHRLISNFSRFYSRFGTPDIDIKSCLPQKNK